MIITALFALFILPALCLPCLLLCLPCLLESVGIKRKIITINTVYCCCLLALTESVQYQNRIRNVQMMQTVNHTLILPWS